MGKPLTGCWGDANCGARFPRQSNTAVTMPFSSKGSVPTPYTCISKMAKRPSKKQPTSGVVMRLKRKSFSNSSTARKQPSRSSVLPVKRSLSFQVYAVIRAESQPVGPGAVMGVKKLKAVVLDGVSRIGVSDPAAMKRLSRKCLKWVNFPLPLPGGMMASVGTLLRVSPLVFPQDGLLYTSILRKWGTGRPESDVHRVGRLAPEKLGRIQS